MTESVSMRRKLSYGSSLDTLLTNPQLIPVSSKDERYLEKAGDITKLSQKTLKGILKTHEKEGQEKAKALLKGSFKSGQLLPFHAVLAIIALKKGKT